MTRDIEAEIARLAPYASESVQCAKRINRLERELDLARAGTALRAARVDASVALSDARNAALSAHMAGMSERTIADLLDVNRTTVRRWLGKDPKSPHCETCGYWAIDASDLREHVAKNRHSH